MTIIDIKEAVQRRTPVSVRQLYRWLHKLDVKPLGSINRTPRIYPEDSAQRVLKALGFGETNGHRASRLPTMPKLRKARALAKAGK